MSSVVSLKEVAAKRQQELEEMQREAALRVELLTANLAAEEPDDKWMRANTKARGRGRVRVRVEARVSICVWV